jgi:rhizoxin synthesis polyketide synthase RhiF
MKDFISYILNEVKSLRLSKLEALELLKQFHNKQSADEGITFLHPLLQRNTSGLREQRFSSTFNGQEFFLSDHVVQGKPMLPAVAYIEMARMALQESLDATDKGLSIQLQNIAWLQPLILNVNESQTAHIALFAINNDAFEFEIYSQKETLKVIHCTGIAVLKEAMKGIVLNLKDVQASCLNGELAGSKCYDSFQKLGITYGPAHRAIEKILLGDEQVLAKLSLPVILTDTLNDFVLHPAILDSALQAGFCLGGLRDDVDPDQQIPFALEEVRIYQQCKAAMWALIRRSTGKNDTGNIQKLDITLCDELGNVYVNLKGFAFRIIKKEIQPLPAPVTVATLLLKPVLTIQDALPQLITPEYSQHLIISCGHFIELKESLHKKIPAARLISLFSKEKEIDKWFQYYAAHVFGEIKKVTATKINGKVLLQVVISNHLEESLAAGILGLLKTVQLENPQMVCQLIAFAKEEKNIPDKLIQNAISVMDGYIVYKENKRWVIDWQQLPEDKTVTPLWLDRTVYLITGGLGALGFIFAKEIASQTKNVTLILTGRSSLDQTKQAMLDELIALGVNANYRQLDVTDKKNVEQLMEKIICEFKQLNGIIHSAGVIHDNYIIKKTEKEWKTVLQPKVSGVVNLDQASKNLPLDFFILFSSGAGVSGNPGQADYATANAFIDAFAHYRNQLLSDQQRSGQCFSVNWPLWKEGGMKMDETVEQLIEQTTGMVAMDTTSGIAALYQIAKSGQQQVMVMNGKNLDTRLGKDFFKRTTSSVASSISTTAASTVVDKDELNELATNYFKRHIAAIVKIPMEKMDAEAPLENYGIDSIFIMQLTAELEKTFGPLSKTLFFEYQTIHALTGYFLENHYTTMLQVAGVETAPHPSPVHSAAAVNVNTRERSEISKRTQRRFSIPDNDLKNKDSSDIAIIGVAGQYPQSKNIEAYLKNLQEGKDCITEIPQSRWDMDLYFDEDKNKPGKSYCKWGGFIEDVEQFDPLFFNISPREAEIIDPQERIFLETVWNLLESSGYTRETIQKNYEGKVGIYVGAMYQQYHLLNSDILRESVASLSSHSSIANRVSYFFNLTGPSVAVDTACSSSMVALHMACESLNKSESRLAIVGGVNLSVHPKKYIGLSMTRMIGSTRDSRSFSDGDGYIPAEGVGAVLLKTVSQAVKDGDTILAVIKSTATNHNGHTNGFNVPNPNAQAQLMEDHFRNAGIDPQTISYVEAAANGSALGDPIEFSALTKVFKKHTSGQYVCSLGSVKSNIGHAESASGIAQLTKVILQLHHKQLFASIKSTPINPALDLSNSPFYLQQELQEWKRPILKINGEEQEVPLRATVSSFGAGGTNVHVILEEYNCAGIQDEIALSPQVVILSAKNKERLHVMIANMLAFLENNKHMHLPALAYTLQLGRETMDHRFAMVVNNMDETIQGLNDYLSSIKNNLHKSNTAIPTYTGDKDEEVSELKNLLTGKTRDILLSSSLQEKNLKQLALYWTKGLKIPWEQLHEYKKIKMITLPGYPFDKRKCWLEPNTIDQIVLQEANLVNLKIDNKGSREGIEEKTRSIVSYLLGLQKEEISLDVPLEKYGMDSILFMQLLQQLQMNISPLISAASLQYCKTINDMLVVINNYEAVEPLTISSQNNEFVPKKWPQFPELIYLNQSVKGKPVFWFHAAAGGVEVYHKLAQNSQRPFYGIQARGYMTDRSPLIGIQAMAAYYVQIIQSVQSQGPYDFGGYSLGGLLAYEVTRQLQEMGQVINSIVMLDTLIGDELKNETFNKKDALFQTMNMLIFSNLQQQPEKFSEALIHCDQVNKRLSANQLLKQLVNLAKPLGLVKTEKQIHSFIEKNVMLQEAFETDLYKIKPLPDPDAVTCYYFRNKSGLFLGELRPYFLLTKDKISFDHVHYWNEWEKQIPNFHRIDVNAANHMMLLSDPKVYDIIVNFCSQLYAENVLNSDLLELTRNKTKEIPGIKKTLLKTVYTN